MAVSFTQKQKQAIFLRKKSLLVSAAAGSGKTAVLTERIVSMVCDETNPVDIDRLLVVTFTNAAASEMRERIRLALSKRLEQAPENEHLQRQASLLHNAQITTIDSFCLFVIRNYFNEIGLDPAFRIVDEGELKLIHSEVMEELLEACFEAQDEAFFNCLESLSKSGNEKPLAKQIERLYRFAMSCPWPEEWLQEMLQSYAFESVEEMEESAWASFLKEDIENLLEGCAEKIKEGLLLCEEADGPYWYAPVLKEEEKALRDMLFSLAGKGWMEALWQNLSAFSFGRLPSKKDDAVSLEKRELVKTMRGTVKDTLARIKEQYFYESPKTALLDMQKSFPLMEKLILMTLDFKRKLDEKKREKNVIDFGDMEHFALEILLKKTEAGRKPGKAALDLQSYFREILIDEYQDSNLVQEYILQTVSGEAGGVYNRFLVGDVKQSIYKFRLARPEIFMEKLHTYGKGEEAENTMRLDLHQNFRSRKEVVESVNFMFRRIMHSRLGGVEYDKKAELGAGASYPQQEEGKSNTELWLLEQDKESAMGKTEQEARLLAGRIRKLMQTFQVTDAQTGTLRSLHYGDIVILLRANAGWDDTLKSVLSECGIPAHVATRTGYFAAEEIRTVMNFLRIVDNPLQDIPLYGVLKSPMVNMTEEEIALIRAACLGEGLYEGLKHALVEKGREASEIKAPDAVLESPVQLSRETLEKARAFMALLVSCREKSAYVPVQKLIRQILSETGYLRYVSALPGGGQRSANMEMLLQKAADFEKTSYFGLFHFIRYMEQLEKYDVDFGEAGTVDENADVVRIMSIHKSKGLEFPVCFVAGLSRRFNIQDTAEPLLMDVDMGIGCEYVDPDLRIRCTTFKKNVIARKIQKDNLGEELRILYVAATRAKEKLILTGCVENLEKTAFTWGQSPTDKKKQASFLDLSGAGSLLDFILEAWRGHPAFSLYGQDTQDILVEEYPYMEAHLCTGKEVHLEEEKETVREGMRKIRLLQYEAEPVDKVWQETWIKRFAYRYPHENLADLYTKTTVSELKRERMLETDEAAEQMFEAREAAVYVPAFRRRKEELSGTVRGNAYHRVMELLDFGKFTHLEKREEKEIEIKEQLQAFLESGRLSEEYMTCVSCEKIGRFLESSLAERMAAADRAGGLYREQPFVMGIPAKEIRASFPKEETVLIQGIIDVYFEEEDGLVVADYKTDGVKEPEALVNRYALQLSYYARALEQLTGKPVKEKIIYAFRLEKEIVLD